MRFEPDRTLLRRIYQLSWPTVIEQGLQTLVQYVDTAMVGQISARASASVGLTVTTTWFVTGPLFALGMGFLSCISKAIGAENTMKARRTSTQAFFTVLILGLFLSAASLLVGPQLPVWLGAKEEIRRDASLYFMIVSAPMVFRASIIMFGSVLRGCGDTKTPMLVNALVNFINIVFNFLLIPRYGVGGAAAATALSIVAGGLLMFAAVCRNPKVAPLRREFRLNGPIMRECINVGLPVACGRGLNSFGQVIFTTLIAQLGTIAVATHAITLAAEQAFYVPGSAMQAASATLSGMAVGRRDEERLMKTTRTILFLAAGIVAVLCIPLLCFPSAIIGVFTKDPEVIVLGARLLRIVAISEPFFAAAVVLEGALNGAGDAKIPFLCSISGMWLIRIPLTFVFIRMLSLGLEFAWVAMVGDTLLRFTLIYLRFRGSSWKREVYLPAEQPSASN